VTASRPPTDDLGTRVRDAIARERGPRAWLCARSTRVRLALAVGAAVLVTVAVALAIPRADLAACPPLLLGTSLGVLLAGTILAAALVLRPLHRPPVRPGTWIAAAALALALPVLVVLGAPWHDASRAHPESFAGTGADFLACALECFALGVILALPALVLLRLLDRTQRLGWPRVVLLAGATGLVGNLALAVHCPIVAPLHLLAGHATVPLGAFLLLALARRRGAAR
jgi:hypothetical protein